MAVRVEAGIAAGDLGVEDPGAGADASAEHRAAAHPHPGAQPPHQVVEVVAVLVPVAQLGARSGALGRQVDAYGIDGAPLVARRDRLWPVLPGPPCSADHMRGPHPLTRLA
ncbi:hypothetical protein AN221_09025 [Streptomyces nanshensis]|uniref:Uncharacterized protein n=1 Tax=Streptomyces nanshensis TaxID=518642 RepID=A0A1E7LXZ2_9ACTN|nr:hypothetical protein AN221_09025 [Streptomyces nanshensis]